MFYYVLEARVILIIRGVLFIRIKFNISCLYLLRSCVYGMSFPLSAYFPYAYGVFIFVLVIVYFG
jgi:hypothetical protein